MINYIPIKIIHPRDVPDVMEATTNLGLLRFNPKKVQYFIIENNNVNLNRTTLTIMTMILGIDDDLDIGGIWADNIVTGNNDFRLGTRDSIRAAFRSVTNNFPSQNPSTILYKGVRLNVAEFS